MNIDGLALSLLRRSDKLGSLSSLAKPWRGCLFPLSRRNGNEYSGADRLPSLSSNSLSLRRRSPSRAAVGRSRGSELNFAKSEGPNVVLALLTDPIAGLL